MGTHRPQVSFANFRKRRARLGTFAEPSSLTIATGCETNRPLLLCDNLAQTNLCPIFNCPSISLKLTVLCLSTVETHRLRLVANIPDLINSLRFRKRAACRIVSNEMVHAASLSRFSCTCRTSALCCRRRFGSECKQP